VGVELHPPARVRGTLETPSLMIAKGVVFEGQCKMDEAPGARGGKTPLPGPVAVK
jgi:cytoskeletal protein CcmA (bactofilin family)